MDKKNIAAVVLAGGRSSRMGNDKALLDYNGHPLIDHMIATLEKLGLGDIYVSGDLEGYNCIPDTSPHEGPAWAIYDVLQKLKNYEGVIFVPVDMPLLNIEMLQILIDKEVSSYFNSFPLPAFIKRPYLQKRTKSVKNLLDILNASPVTLPKEFDICMRNTNTPEQWQEVLEA